VSFESIKEALHREPFEPFRIVTSSGESYSVRNPDLVVMMKSRMFIAFPDGHRSTFVNYLHITAVDTAGIGHRGNGHSKRRKRRG
jgi:uncharacterized NAD(P)/FAD-binding protein YdhS